MNGTETPQTAKRTRRKVEYELLQDGNLLTPQTPISSVSDAIKYCKGKKLTGVFTVKAIKGTFTIKEEKRLSVEVG